METGNGRSCNASSLMKKLTSYISGLPTLPTALFKKIKGLARRKQSTEASQPDYKGLPQWPDSYIDCEDFLLLQEIELTDYKGLRTAAQKFPASLLTRIRPKTLDRYILGKFLGTYFMATILLLAIIAMFDITEKLDAFLTAPLKETQTHLYFGCVSSA